MDREREHLCRHLEEMVVSNELLEELRQEFADDIKSVRRIESIQCVGDLLKLLVKRDMMNKPSLGRICNILNVSPGN